MADVLFVHNNFPGQFGAIATALKAAGDRCVAIGSHTARGVPGLPVVRWKSSRGTTSGILPTAIRAEIDLIRGQAAAQCAVQLKDKGFDPELIIGHPGWGETLFIKEIFPKAKQIAHGEFYYRTEGADVGFDPEFGPLDLATRMRVHAKNMGVALAYAEADRIVCPTEFQASLLPEVFRDRVTLIHEGVDTDQVQPNPQATFELEDGRVLDRSASVVTFINRRFEPLRGFHIFMRALPKLLEAAPNTQVLMIGGKGTGGYGGQAPDGKTWTEIMLGELGGRLDLSRVHFVGAVPWPRMLAALSISSAHVYYTYPFVLSWSLLEAMASECLVIGSDTAPVRDALQEGRNGVLLDFFDVDALSQAMIEAVRRPEAFGHLRRAARRTVLERFDRRRVCNPAWLDLVADVRAGRS